RVLGMLDDKIELNRRMNTTLDTIAQALFRSWFVDFDPVRAKAEGRDHGLPEPLANLFPARLVDSELGEIPEGWEIGRLDSVLVLPTLIPPMGLIAAFERIATLSLKRQKLNDDQSVTLAALRDTLLPKLISGELRIHDAKRMIERHA